MKSIKYLLYLLLFILLAIPADAGWYYGGCNEYSCTGNGAHLWECDSTTVNDPVFCHIGCSDADISASAAGSDESIADGVCSFDDASSDSGDYYTFDAPSATIEDAGTVFIKFRVNAWVDEARFFIIWGESDWLMIELNTTDAGVADRNLSGFYRANSVTDTVNLIGDNVDTGVWFIVRHYWNNDEAGNDHRITLYSASGVEIEDVNEDDDLEEFVAGDPGADDLQIGNAAAVNDSDIDVDYVHLYEGWQEIDPNG